MISRFEQGMLSFLMIKPYKTWDMLACEIEPLEPSAYSMPPPYPIEALLVKTTG